MRAATPEGRGSVARGWSREDLAAALVIAFLAAGPVAFARDAVDGFEQVKLWALLTAALALVALAPRLVDPRERSPGRIPVASAVALLYLGAAVLATAFSRSVPTSLFGADGSHAGLTSVAATVALFLVARRLCLAAPRRLAFVAAVAVGTAVASTYAAAQALGVDPFAWTHLAEFGGWSRPFGTMGHPNHLGSLLAIVLPVQLWLVCAALARGRRRDAVVLALGTALSAAVLVATLSRAAWGGAFTGLVVFLLLSVRGGRRRLAVAIAGAALAIVLGALVLRAPAAPARLTVALDERVRGLLEAGPRPQIWGAAWDAFRESPILGSGLDTFALAFQRHRPPLYWTREYDATPTKAHNELLHALATQGIVGAVAWCLVVAGVVALGERALRRTAGPERGLAAALLGGWVAFVVLAQAGFAVVVTTSILAVWAAILDALSRGASPAGPVPRVVPASGWLSRTPIAAPAATMAFAAGWLFGEGPLGPRIGPAIGVPAAVVVAAASQAWAASRVLSDLPVIAPGGGARPLDRRAPGPAAGSVASGLRVAWIGAVLAAWVLLVGRPFAASVAAHRAETAPTPGEAVELLTKAQRLDPLRVAYLRRLGLAMLKIDPPGNDLRDQTAWLARSRETLARAARLVPADAYGWASLAVPETKLAVAGLLDREQPFRSLQEALRLDPANVTFRLAGANAALELGDLERARRYAGEAAGILPDFAPARAQLAHVAAREGRLDDAIRLLREAVALEWYGQTEASHTARANLASLLIRARLFPEAEQVARALAGEDPSFAPGRYQLGRALEGLGLSDEAITEYEATLRLEPSHRGAREGLRREARRAPEPTGGGR